jgi:phage shock protein B
MSSFVFFFIPTLIFLGLVLPLWLALYYASRWRTSKGLSEEEKQTLNAAMAEIERLESRIETLETILDAEQPDWHTKHSAE